MFLFLFNKPIIYINGDHRPFVQEHPLCLFEQILPKYKYTNTQVFLWYLGCEHQILNTVKYRQILYGNKP